MARGVVWRPDKGRMPRVATLLPKVLLQLPDSPRGVQPFPAPPTLSSKITWTTYWIRTWKVAKANVYLLEEL